MMLDQGLSVLSEEYRRHTGVPLEVSTLNKIRRIVRLRRCEPRSYAVRAGQISQSVFMVVSGLFRSYRIDDSVNNGLEVPLFTGGQVPLLFDYSGSTTPIFNRSFIL